MVNRLRCSGPALIFLTMLLAFLAQDAHAMEPGTWSALAYNSVHPNSPLTYGAPLGGYYYIRGPAGTNTWQVKYEAPPEAKDPNYIGTIASQWVSKPHIYSIRPLSPGWIHVIAYSGSIQVDDAYYCIYEVGLEEGDQGIGPSNVPSFDVRYGSNTTQGFSGFGGPHVDWWTHAEEFFGYDDRTQGASEPWTGLQLPTGDRVPIWAPEPMLKEGPSCNSLLATRRKEETILLMIRGPAEPGITIPLHLVMSHVPGGTGEMAPGTTGSYPYYIAKGEFTPPRKPDPEDSNETIGIGGMFNWPGGPNARQLSRGANLDVNGNSRWIVRVPWQGLLVSGFYGDVEVEVSVPNPCYVAKSEGFTLYAEEEGIVQGKRGTVPRLLTLAEQEYSVALEDLETHWYRRVTYTKSPVDVDARDMTLGLGCVIMEGGYVDDEALFEIVSGVYADSDEKYEANYFDEVMFNVANKHLDTSDRAFIRAEVPEDRTQSLLLQMRGYIGTIEVGLAEGADKYDTEPVEPGAPDEEFVVAFIDLTVDANNNEGLDAGDSALEDTAPGMVIPVCSAAGPLRELKLTLSTPITDPDHNRHYNGMDVVLTTTTANGLSGTRFYTDSSGSTELVPSGNEIVFDLTHASDVTWSYSGNQLATGTSISVWVEGVTAGETKLYAVLRSGTGEDVNADSAIVSNVGVTFTKYNGAALSGAEFKVYSDNTSDEPEVDLEVTLNPAVEDWVVYWSLEDVDDRTTDASPIDTTGASGNDNRETSLPTLDSATSQTGSSGRATIGYDASTYGGDNYRMQVRLFSSQTDPSAESADIEVWTRRTVELDLMHGITAAGAGKTGLDSTGESVFMVFTYATTTLSSSSQYSRPTVEPDLLDANENADSSDPKDVDPNETDGKTLPTDASASNRDAPNDNGDSVLTDFSSLSATLRSQYEFVYSCDVAVLFAASLRSGSHDLHVLGVYRLHPSAFAAGIRGLTSLDHSSGLVFTSASPNPNVTCPHEVFSHQWKMGYGGTIGHDGPPAYAARGRAAGHSSPTTCLLAQYAPGSQMCDACKDCIRCRR